MIHHCDTLLNATQSKRSPTEKELLKEFDRVDVKYSKGTKQHSMLIPHLSYVVGLCQCFVSVTTLAQCLFHFSSILSLFMPEFLTMIITNSKRNHEMTHLYTRAPSHVEEGDIFLPHGQLCFSLGTFSRKITLSG